MIDHLLLVGLDLSLVILTTLRLTRLITTDTLTEPLRDAARYNDFASDLLNCPYCIGFWLGCFVLATFAIAGGPEHTEAWWRWCSAPLALNYLVAHISSVRD